MSGFFEVQRRQRQRTFVWSITGVVLLTAIGYVITLPLQLWVSCNAPDTDTCVPLKFEPGLASKIVLFVAIYLLLAWLVASRQAYPNTGRPPSSDPHERRLQPIVEQMAIASGAAVPRVVVIDDLDLNAYATLDRGEGVIAVTSCLLVTLDDRELTGVVAHEMAHLKNRDARVIWVATFGVGLVMVLAIAVTLFALRAPRASDQPSDENDDVDDEDEESDGMGYTAAIAFVLAVLLWLFAIPAALIVRATISRRREQLADASAVQFTRDPTALRGALEKIATSTHQPAALRLSNAALWIRNPLSGPGRLSWIRRLLDTHPPIERRIAWLRSLEGANALWNDFT